MYQLPVSISTMQITRPRINIQYPQVTGGTNAAAQQKMNSDILNLVNRLIRDQGYYQDPKVQITGSYEIKTNEKGILSLSIINDAYSGGAHGLTIIKSLTMDTKTGRVYSLKDLFKEGSKYIETLNKIILKQIMDRGIYLLGKFNTIRPEHDYYIANKSIVIYFQLYEITPYASGFPYFPISIYELKSIINEKGPLNILLY